MHYVNKFLGFPQQHILGFVISFLNDYCFLLCLLLGHKKYYVIVKDLKMPCGIMVLQL
jgi:hypothetical protein